MTEQLTLFDFQQRSVSADLSEYRRRTGHAAPPPCTCGPCRERELAKYEETAGGSDGRP